MIFRGSLFIFLALILFIDKSDQQKTLRSSNQSSAKSILDLQILCLPLRLLLCIPEVCSSTTEAVEEKFPSKTIMCAPTSGTGTRASKIQDGEDIDVLRSLDPRPNGKLPEP